MGEESYNGGNSLYEGNSDPSSSSGSKALCGSISLKKTMLTRQVNYFLHIMSYLTSFFMINNQDHNHNDSPVQEGTAGNNS